MTTALLLIDLQKALLLASTPPADRDGVLARDAGLLDKARAEGVPVFHVQHDGGAGDDLERGTPGWEIHPAVAPRTGEPVVEKKECSAFLGTTLDQQLRAAGITRLVVAGMQTEYCVDTSCRAAHGLGYDVTLVSDGHTTFDSPVIAGTQIVAHHNKTLNGSFVRLLPAAKVQFQP